MKEKSMHQRRKDNKISRTEYLNLWAQGKGYTDYYKYRDYIAQRKGYINDCEYQRRFARRYYQSHKEEYAEYKKRYWKTPTGKIASNKHISKRNRELGYDVINIQDANNLEYVGHHLNLNDVIYIPKELHKSVWHRQSDKQTMNKINSMAINWYLEHIGFNIRKI